MQVFSKANTKITNFDNLNYILKKKIYLFHCLYFFRTNLFLTTCILFFSSNLFCQVDTLSRFNDSIFSATDTVFFTNDSLNIAEIAANSLKTDSLNRKKRLSPDALQASIKYISQDSIIINLKNKKILLFEDAKAYYEDITLESAFMEYGFVNSELYASGIADSSGHIHKPPVFKQGDGEYCSQEIRYNFKSKKGKVTKVITVEGEGYIHGHYIKHIDEKTSYIKDGQYTTCNLEHPHYQIRFGKAKLIQKEKIVTGPAYISFGNIPTPVAIPFGYFPIEKDRSSGILIPKYGEGANRGFYFEDFGYYFGINDNFDLALLGYITTRGSWSAKAKANYVFNYKCNGEIELAFGQNFSGERQTPSRFHTNDYRVHWEHRQDAKAHPTTKFSARVDIMSAPYNKYNSTSTVDYLSNEFASSINLSTNANGFFFFDGAITYRQNTNSKDIGISLPDLNMSVRQFYPFRKKFKAGKLKWYDNISMKWNSQIMSQINTKDTLFVKKQTWEEIRTGIQHTIPLNVPIKLGKGFNWNTGATWVEKWYLQRDVQEFYTDFDTIQNQDIPIIKDVFQRGFYALHDLKIFTSLTTKIYVTYASKLGPTALRHVISPDISFTYRPKLNGQAYGTYFNTITGKEVEYSYFSGGGVSKNMEAITMFTVNNNLELKVKSKKDTITGTRKITIFDNISISCGYDFAADSLRWKPLSISGRTSIFSFLDVTFRLSFDPYIINDNGIRVNQTEAKVNKRGMRFSGSDLNIGINWRIDQDFFKGKKKDEASANKNPQESETVFSENALGIPNRRPDFRNPWSITINYTFAYGTRDNLWYYMNKSNKKYEGDIIQTINISGDINITRKWKIGFTTGYDIKQKDFSYTSIDIYRDLHCWEMKFQWVPLGGRKGWNFQINVKASVLQDLKFKMQKDFRDNF